MVTRERGDESGTTTIVTISFTIFFWADAFIRYRFRRPMQIIPLILNKPSTSPLRPPSTTFYLPHIRTTTSCSEMIDNSRKGGKQRQRGIRNSFKWKVNTSSVVVLDCTEMSPSLKLNLIELHRTSATAISSTVGLIHIYWSSNHSRRPMGAVVRQCWKG